MVAELQVDPARLNLPETGIYVRALNAEGRWDSVDINHLTKESLDGWLRERNDINWPISVIMAMLGHPR